MNITANHRAIKAYYEKRAELAQQGVTHEMAVREAFKGLLEQLAGVNKWTLVVEQKVEGVSRRIVPDGTLRDSNTLPRGYWEAKDTRDDLDVEIERKFARGYPQTNIIFEDTRRAVLFQNGQREGEYLLDQPEQVATLFNRFLEYRQPNVAGFEQAVERFKSDVPELARGLLLRINEAHKGNKAFQSAFAAFYELCKTALNPNISTDAVNEMLIQHMLTERLMRTVFDNPDFTRRNAIAAEVEKVIDALTSRSFSRKEFLGQLDYFYEAIEAAARDLTGFTERQHFINTVYERFFQGYAVKVADTHGIVYTPQPIVDFMCAAVQEVLRDEFGYGLTHEKVCIIDPATGTGNFIVNLLRRIHAEDPAALPDVYANRLFANEVMLLPYYVASLNIEHAYYELTGEYAPFEGLCFVDTLDLAEGAQMKLAFMTEKNSERVERQKKAEITVIIGNPPYNVGQLNENDNNKNRKYEVIDKRVSETYARDSKATNKNALSDAYVKFFRWAADRLQGRDGIVCYVSNNSFVDQIAFDGMRKHLLQDFTRIYHLDLHGNVRQNPKLSGTTHNVFGIKVGVGITVAVYSAKHSESKLFYHRVPEMWTKGEKLAELVRNVDLKGRHNSLNTVPWKELTPDIHNTWILAENTEEFETFISIGSRETKRLRGRDTETIFKLFGRGLETTRDDWVYDFNRQHLVEKVTRMIETYNSEIDRWRRAGKPQNVDNFVLADDARIKWSSRLKETLIREEYAEYNDSKVRNALYRPFVKQMVFFDHILNHRQSISPRIFPTPASEQENLVIGVTDAGSEKPFMVMMANTISDLHLVGAGSSTQCFPFYVYDEDGSNRRENITDWALQQFRTHYQDESISKWDIFYYVYALLHHPGYRERYADNLKRELPRIPFSLNFWAYAEVGRKLAQLHVNYETVDPYPLEFRWTAGKPVSWRVEKMRLSADKTMLKVNDSLTLAGIPPETFEYRLGNRSALEWVIDQYQVKTDKRSGITSDPNSYSDDEQYIVRLGSVDI